MDALAKSGMRTGAIGWVRFGQLRRDELGWHDYPDCSDFPAGHINPAER